VKWPLLMTLAGQFKPRRRRALALKKAMEMHRNGDFSGACKALRSATKEDAPWSAEMKADLHILWAQCQFYANRDVREALRLLAAAREMGCDEAYYQAIKGEILWDSGERDAAVKAFEMSVAENPTAWYLTHLAWALSRLEDERAEGVWREVVKDDPANCVAHAYLGHEASRRGRRDEAVSMLKKAEELARTARDVFEVAALYHDLEDYEAAIQKYNRAEKLDCPQKGMLYAAIASCYIALGDRKAARTYMLRAEQYDPEDNYVRETTQEYNKKWQRLSDPARRMTGADPRVRRSP